MLSVNPKRITSSNASIRREMGVNRVKRHKPSHNAAGCLKMPYLRVIWHEARGDIIEKFIEK